MFKYQIQNHKIGSERGFTSPKRSEGGQALLVVVVFLLFISLAVGFGILTPIISDARIAGTGTLSAQSLFLSEAGVEDVVYRLRNSMDVENTEVLSLVGATTTTITTDMIGNEKSIRSEGRARDIVRASQVHVSTESGASFNFGVQAGEGGFDMRNSAQIIGSAYSNGPITGTSKNVIRGDAVSAGSEGLFDGLHGTSSVYAHIIQDAEIDEDAYYQSISNTTVGGTEHPDSEDKPKIDLPITDSSIEDWKDDAASGGVISCSDVHSIEEDTTLGPVKIGCDLDISGDSTITLEGNVWVEGDITISNTVNMEIAQALEGKNIAIVADYPSDQESKGRIELQNFATFSGAGDDSYIIFVSQNNSAEGGGENDAIMVQNTVEGDVLVYAGHGRIVLQNSVDLQQVTAYLIELRNTTEVRYETGLASMLFTAGPGGTWSVDEWKEVK